jgi:hypothetical protein
MEWLDLNHLNSFCKVAWVFDKIFFFKSWPYLTPQMMLSDHSVCMISHQGIKLAFLQPTSNDDYM